jgi:hypothetical protein
MKTLTPFPVIDTRKGQKEPKFTLSSSFCRVQGESYVHRETTQKDVSRAFASALVAEKQGEEVVCISIYNFGWNVYVKN